MRVTEHWNRLSRQAVVSPSLEIIQNAAGRGPGQPTAVEMLEQGTRPSPEVSSKLKHSVFCHQLYYCGLVHLRARVKYLKNKSVSVSPAGFGFRLLFLSQQLSEHIRTSLLLRFSYFCCLHLLNRKQINHANKDPNMFFEASLISLIRTLLPELLRLP